MFNYSFNPCLEEKLELFKKYGFDYIHWCDNWNDDILYTDEEMKKFAKSIKDHGLLCQDVHGTATTEYKIDSFDKRAHEGFVKLLENRIRFCHEVGGNAVVVHPPWVYKPDFEKRVHVSKKVLESVKELSLALGVTLAIENCQKGDHHVLADYFQLFEPEFIGFCYDSGHANINKNLDELMRFGDRLKVTHLHDNNETEDDHQYPGWGNIDWKKVTKWLKRLNYDKPWNLEVTHYPDHFKGSMNMYLEKTLDHARKLSVD
jgi:sugar phosphate isomerase/epimerase